MRYRVFLVCCFIILFCSLSYAQEIASPVEVNGDQVEYFPKEKKVTGVGNVSIDHGDVKLVCDKITVYTESKDAYAEGNVVLDTPTGRLKGQEVKYNFGTKKGEILDARIKSGE